MEIQIRPLNKCHMNAIVSERNNVLETLRTPFMLNNDMQEQYFNDIICDRKSTTRYYAFYIDAAFMGYGGIENIQWENRTAEISILIFEDWRGKGYGKEAVDLILDQAFNYMNLDSIYGEVYECGNVEFWKKIVEKYNGFTTGLPNRKYYKGKYYDSMYFNIENKLFKEVEQI